MVCICAACALHVEHSQPQKDKLLLLRKSLQLKMLQLSRVARKSDVVGAISKVEQEILGGILHIMKCSDAQVDTAQISFRITRNAVKNDEAQKQYRMCDARSFGESLN